jgi:PIN domain nuclease of toxin-antitoxin system
MKILLDTHIFLWFISGDSRLSIDIRDAIRNTDNEVYLSVISVWESIIKHQLGKLPYQSPMKPIYPNSVICIKSSALPLMKRALLNWPNCHRFTVILLTE